MNNWFERLTGGAESWALREAGVASATVTPVLSLGAFDEVEVELTADLVPVLAVTSYVDTGRAATDTVRVTLTIPRPTLTIAGELLKAASDTVRPVLTVAYGLERPQEGAASLVPVLTVTNAVSTNAAEKLSAVSILPVVSVTSAVTDLFQDKAVSVTLTPALGYALSVEQLAGLVQWTVYEALTPRLTVTSAVTGSAGDVDRIRISVKPYGRVRIRPA